jgi:bifunctional DNA-binding transcriptional regulator/antitoxin component of YhaV-PrlF toxin-antitoxin module
MDILISDFEVRDDGTVVLPVELWETYGLKPGNTLSAVRTENGIILAPRAVLIDKLLDEIGDDLRAKGFTFEQMMADRKAIRQEIYEEEYTPKENKD